MDFIQIFFLVPLIVLATIGINSIGDWWRGYHLNNYAQDILNEIWTDNQRTLLMKVFSEKERRKIERQMKPEIIYIALEFIKEDLEKKDSKVYPQLEETVKRL